MKASELLMMSPEDCIVIEDAEKGIIAAHSAGMKSIAIPNRQTKNNNFEIANFIIKDLSELDKVLRLIES